MSKEEVTEILERLARIEAKLENGLCQDIEDHEKRLRVLERAYWGAVGVITFLQITQIVLNFVRFWWR
ncbi:MAG: hypothetical protein ABIM88_04225 [candidate division WOR-3 bacterium]